MNKKEALQFYKRVFGLALPIAAQSLITIGVNMLDTMIDTGSFKNVASAIKLKFFLLSKDEANDLFDNDQARSIGFPWWMRSQGRFADKDTKCIFRNKSCSIIFATDVSFTWLVCKYFNTILLYFLWLALETQEC